jgi:receptor-type tyrosine-protein phosphatase Q
MFTNFWILNTFLFLFGATVGVFARTDLTLEDGSVGVEVVEATLRKIRRSEIFQDDFDFFKRLAYVESEDGESNSTANDGGIWQVNEEYLEQSKQPSLAGLHAQISGNFNISWAGADLEDLRKPLFSAIAARLYLASLGEEIPQSLEGQSDFWLRHYNQRDATRQTFSSKVDEMENKTSPCKGKMDFVLVLDGSGSVGELNFLKAQEFVVSLIESFSLVSSRFGYIAYSNFVDTIFLLDNTLSMDQIRRLISEYEYPGGGTNTNAAIKEAVDAFSAASPRPGVPKVLAVLTDGQSGTGVGNIELARQANISTLAVGIGAETDPEELLEIAYGESSNVFSLNDFDVLKDFYRRLNAETCNIAQTPGFGVITRDELVAKEKRFYEFPLPSNGITVEITVEEGGITGFYSLVESNPSSAFNDGQLNSTTFIPSDGVSTHAYLTIQGLAELNIYSISARL